MMNEEVDISPKLRISIIGAGNVATHLAGSLCKTATLVQIYAPHMASATRLASKTGAEAIDCVSDLDLSVDCVIISIKDDAVTSLLDQISSAFSNQAADLERIIWMHTAGSVDMSGFPAAMPNHGILYPLQTFSRDVPVKMHEVPFLTEGSNEHASRIITRIAGMLSRNVRYLDSESRRQLHAAAVLACNMPMYLWSLAHDVLKSHDLDFEIMRPLLQATLDKTCTCAPINGMTGPARRGDTDTIRKHLHDLPPQAAKVYAMLSNEILKAFNHPTLPTDNEQNQL